MKLKVRIPKGQSRPGARPGGCWELYAPWMRQAPSSRKSARGPHISQAPLTGDQSPSWKPQVRTFHPLPLWAVLFCRTKLQRAESGRNGRVTPNGPWPAMSGAAKGWECPGGIWEVFSRLCPLPKGPVSPSPLHFNHPLKRVKREQSQAPKEHAEPRSTTSNICFLPV